MIGRWYVVQSNSNAEAKALMHLTRQGFEAYLPRYLKRRKHSRRIEIVPAPLFPRYLFVAIDIEKQRWRSIFSTIGVSRLLCNGDVPAPVPEQVVRAIQCRQDASGYVKLERAPALRTGDKIRVLEGAFADCFGLYEGLRDAERVAILLDLLGQKVRVTVGLNSVAAA